MQAQAPTQRTKDRAPLRARHDESEGRTLESEPRAHPARRSGGGPVVETTLLELVRAVAEETDDEREVVATILHMLHAGRVRLVGSFRGHDRLDAA